MDVDSVLSQLEGVRKSGSGWVARCPLHEDNTASMKVDEKDGTILVKCHAGCDQKELAAKLGLGGNGHNPQEPEATYGYLDERGQLLFQSLRFPGKRFRQRRIDPNAQTEDGWVWDLTGVRLVPYRLPEVIQGVAEGQTIFITEGEKDADRLRQEGRVATCNPMGAGKWREEFSQYFRGATHVIIVADRDEPGRKHAISVFDNLEPVAQNVWIVQAKEGKDVSDHLDAGFAIEELVVADPRTFRRSYQPLDLFVPAPPVAWVVENIVVAGEATLLVADGGTGKSYFALAMSLAVSDGGSFLGQRTKQGRVIYVDEEGSRDLALQRLQELGATHEQKQSIDYLNFAGVDLVKHPDRLIADAKLVDPILIVIDSHAKVTKSVGDENSNNEMGRVWDQGFLRLAKETGAAVLVIHHTAAPGYGPSKPRGATQIRNSADQVLTLFKDKETDTMIVYPSKPRRKTQTIRFRFLEIPYGGGYRLEALA